MRPHFGDLSHVHDRQHSHPQPHGQRRRVLRAVGRRGSAGEAIAVADSRSQPPLGRLQPDPVRPHGVVARPRVLAPRARRIGTHARRIPRRGLHPRSRRGREGSPQEVRVGRALARCGSSRWASPRNCRTSSPPWCCSTHRGRASCRGSRPHHTAPSGPRFANTPERKDVGSCGEELMELRLPTAKPGETIRFGDTRDAASLRFVGAVPARPRPGGIHPERSKKPLARRLRCTRHREAREVPAAPGRVRSGAGRNAPARRCETARCRATRLHAWICPASDTCCTGKTRRRPCGCYTHSWVRCSNSTNPASVSRTGVSRKTLP